MSNSTDFSNIDFSHCQICRLSFALSGQSQIVPSMCNDCYVTWQAGETDLPACSECTEGVGLYNCEFCEAPLCINCDCSLCER